MSFSVPGGFSGGDAILAFTAIQQGRLNEQMTDEMSLADLRSQMASDLTDIKAHLEQANRYPEKFSDLDEELQAFLAKYGDQPALDEVVSAVKEIADNVHGRVEEHNQAVSANHNGYGARHATWVSQGRVGKEPEPEPDPPMGKYNDKTIQDWLEQITGKLDASGTSDQLAMIHIKQLNDNINNATGIASGIIESRNNALAAVINNFA